MSTQVKHRRGSTSEIDNFTPAVGEIVIDADTNDMVLGDGVKEGGHRFSPKGEKIIDTIAAMKSDGSLKVGRIVKTVNYYDDKVGGGESYEIVAGSTGTDDGGSYHDLNNGLQAKLIVDNTKGVSVRSFGIRPDTAASSTTNVAQFAAWKTFCDAFEYTGVIDADSQSFYIDTAILLPKFYRATGNNNAQSDPSIIGGNVIYQHGSYGIGSGNLHVSNDFIVNGGQNHRLADVRANGRIVYAGFSDQIGMFWCYFENMRGRMFFDVSVFAVNANQFVNCNPFGDDTEYGIEISDNGGVLERECHMNQFIGCDISRTKGVINNSVKNQVNYIIGGYGEMMTGNYIADGSNFSIMNNNLDDTGTYTVGLHNSVMNTADISSRTGGDFLPIPLQNKAAGGVWDALDDTGKPICFGGSGAVISDPNAPFGSFRLYGETTTSDFRTATITIPKILNGGRFPQRYSMTAIWRGDLPAAIDVAGEAYAPGKCCTDLGNNYWLIRISGLGSASSDTVITIFRTTTGGVSKEGYLGNVYVSEGKIAPLPAAPYLQEEPATSFNYIAGGLLVQDKRQDLGYSAASPKILTYNFDIPYKAGTTPLVRVTLEALNVTSAGRTVGIQVYEVDENGFTVYVTHNGDYTGRVHWSASGLVDKGV